MLDYVTSTQYAGEQHDEVRSSKACVYGHAQAVDAAGKTQSGLGGLRGAVLLNDARRSPRQPFHRQHTAGGLLWQLHHWLE